MTATFTLYFYWSLLCNFETKKLFHLKILKHFKTKLFIQNQLNQNKSYLEIKKIEHYIFYFFIMFDTDREELNHEVALDALKEEAGHKKMLLEQFIYEFGRINKAKDKPERQTS